MISLAFFESIENLLNNPQTTSSYVLNEVVTRVGKTLGADRCFLWVRNPSTFLSCGAFVWCRNETIPTLTSEQRSWHDERWLPSQDPLYAAALNCKPSIYITDVTTEASEIVNSRFEEVHFGHRALIHAHIIGDNELWGILQPCMFTVSRQWLPVEKDLIEWLLPKLVPIVKEFVNESQMNFR